MTEFEKSLDNIRTKIKRLESTSRKDFENIIGHFMMIKFGKILDNLSKDLDMTKEQIESQLGKIFIDYQSRAKLKSLYDEGHECPYFKNAPPEYKKVLGAYLTLWESAETAGKKNILKQKMRDPFQIFPEMRQELFQQIFSTEDAETILHYPIFKAFDSLLKGDFYELLIPAKKGTYELQITRLVPIMWVNYMHGKYQVKKAARDYIAEGFMISPSSLEKWENQLRKIPAALVQIEGALHAGAFDRGNQAKISDPDVLRAEVGASIDSWPINSEFYHSAIRARDILKQVPLRTEIFDAIKYSTGNKDPQKNKRNKTAN